MKKQFNPTIVAMVCGITLSLGALSSALADNNVVGSAPPAQASAASAPASNSPAIPATNNPAANSPAAAINNNPAASTLPADSSVDLNTSFGGNNSETVGLTLGQRIARLEQQVTNIINLNEMQKISSLQVQLQQLSGQVEVLQHNLKQLDSQQRSFYQDLDQRINQIKTLTSDDQTVTPATPKASAPSSKSKLPAANKPIPQPGISGAHRHGGSKQHLVKGKHAKVAGVTT